MKKKVLAQIMKLQSDLNENKNVIPDAWKPIISIIWLLLELAELFTNDAVDNIIEEIQTAILAFQNQK